MAHTANDGSQHTNRSSMVRQNRRAETPAAKDAQSAETGIHDEVMHHGAAKRVETSTHHEDGHVSKHLHQDAESLHDHADAAFQAPGKESDSTPLQSESLDYNMPGIGGK